MSDVEYGLFWGLAIASAFFILLIIIIAVNRGQRVAELERQIGHDQEQILELIARDRMNKDRLRACGAVTTVAEMHMGKARTIPISDVGLKIKYDTDDMLDFKEDEKE